MRDYKFRGKCKKTGAWLHGSLIQFNNGVSFIFQDTFGASTLSYSGLLSVGMEPINPATVGQYTGLKYHTQRKESYEGDIVEYAGRLCIVKWDSQNAEYYLDSIENTHDQYSAECINDSTYKGNIHDNPELLEG